VQITRCGGPEVLDVVDTPEPEARSGQTLHDVPAVGA
jgi:NADPH2:quinone reductase